ncbi:hypothetical protein [Actinotalea solisilvae]|uniref:hypothetical protein n=1 Tax=Actinotalea solisilvae TaxID=2072922 RepID=UPI0018F114E5|nr:hypothetical protein [Actinotalea solisilvae]
MTGVVFIAYPLTTTPDLAGVERWVIQLRARLVASGMDVVPKLGGRERALAAAGEPDGDLLESNVAAVTRADVVVVLLPTIVEPSSIWVELGMALAARRPLVVAGPADAALPFLARLALQGPGPGGDDGTADARPSAVRILVDVPPSDDAAAASLERVVAAVQSVAG